MSNAEKTPDVSKIAEWSTEDLESYIASFGPNRVPEIAHDLDGYLAYQNATAILEKRRYDKDPRRRDGQGNVLCEQCGGAVMDYGLIFGSHTRTCDCSKRFRFASTAIERVDLSHEMTFDSLVDPDETVADTAGKLRSIVSGEREQGVFMFGLPGRGKTHLSIAAARALLDRGVLVGVFSLAGLVSRIQDTYGYGDATESRGKIVADVCRHSVVVLDDIGKEHRSSNVESIVYELIDGLYTANVILIASSNLPGKDFVERYDGAVLSRLGGMCEKVVIRGDDQRAKKWDW